MFLYILSTIYKCVFLGKEILSKNRLFLEIKNKSNLKLDLTMVPFDGINIEPLRFFAANIRSRAEIIQRQQEECMPPEVILNSKLKKTLDQIDQVPVLTNIKWADVESLLWALVDQLGGRVEYGKGSIVKIKLPNAKPSILL